MCVGFLLLFPKLFSKHINNFFALIIATKLTDSVRRGFAAAM